MFDITEAKIRRKTASTEVA